MEQKIKVLMVDDEEQFRATTKKILNRRGFDTVLAGSGEEAIEKLEENPDVIILDIKMPGIDGHEALMEIKKRSPGIPIIMLTGHGTLSSAKEALSEGAYDYLAKPCDIDVLAAKISDAFRQKKKGGIAGENRVVDVMIPIEEFTKVTMDQMVSHGIEKLKQSLTESVSTSRIMETKHRSVLVFDNEGKIQGILTIEDLLSSIMPPYLSAPKPSMAESIQYSPMFWKGAFQRAITNLEKKRISEIMSPAPLSIDSEANLMEAAYTMFNNRVQRLVVVRLGEVVGVIRALDLFFEMERLLVK